MSAEASGRRCAVVGSPIAHSLSPVLHRAAYVHLGLPWEYTRAEVREGELESFVAGLDGSWRGLSVTMPLKTEALALAEAASPSAVLAGAANTLLFDSGGVARAYNTDVNGMIDSVRHVGGGTASPGEVSSACVWGAGSTAASAMVALSAMNAARAHLHVRSQSRARETLAAADRAGLAPIVEPWALTGACATADIMISTVPAGALDELAGQLGAAARPGRLAFDVVYDPWPTPFAAAWLDAGGSVVSGLDLLVHQAVGQVELMTGERVPADVLYAALP